MSWQKSRKEGKRKKKGKDKFFVLWQSTTHATVQEEKSSTFSFLHYKVFVKVHHVVVFEQVEETEEQAKKSKSWISEYLSLSTPLYLSVRERVWCSCVWLSTNFFPFVFCFLLGENEVHRSTIKGRQRKNKEKSWCDGAEGHAKRHGILWRGLFSSFYLH